MVDYDIVNGYLTNFKMVVADWGSARVDIHGGVFLGGTPVYAGPKTFVDITSKDLFSFGRLAMELMMDKSGTDSKFRNNSYFWLFKNLI